MLTQWLANPNQTSKSKQNFQGSAQILLHTIMMAIDLEGIRNQLIGTGITNPKSYAINFEKCIKLVILLSLQECLSHLASNQKLDLNPKNILLIMSSSNCLVIFKIKGTNESKIDEDSEQPVMIEAKDEIACFTDYLYSNENQPQVVINKLVDELSKIDLFEHSKTKEVMATQFIKAITPPDWIAKMLARVCLYNRYQNDD